MQVEHGAGDQGDASGAPPREPGEAARGASDLKGPVRPQRGTGEKAKADGRTSRSRFRSPQRGSGEEARGRASQSGGPGGAGAQYAVSGADAELFDGVPGLATEPEAPSGLGTEPAAPSEAGTSELQQAANAQLPSSVPASPMQTE